MDTQLYGTIKTKKKRMPWQRAVFIIATLAIPLIKWFTFFIVINGGGLIMAFQRFDENQQLYWTMENFQFVVDSFVSGGTALIAFKNTMIYFGIGLFNTLISGTVFAYFSYKKIWCDTLYRVLGAGFGLMSGVVSTTIIAAYFNPGGPISALYTNIYNLDAPAQVFADSRLANSGLFLYSFWTGIGVNLFTRGAMMRIPEDVIEYSQLDGVTWWGELTKIIAPLIWPTLITLVILQSSSMFMASGPVFFFTEGAYGTTTISYWMFEQQLNATSPNSNNLYFVCALGICVTIVAAPVVLGIRYGLGKVYDKVEY